MRCDTNISSLAPGLAGERAGVRGRKIFVSRPCDNHQHFHNASLALPSWLTFQADLFEKPTLAVGYELKNTGEQREVSNLSLCS